MSEFADRPSNELEPSRTGHILNGKYLLSERLGSGGMGCVYRAHHMITGREVAVKVVRSVFARHPEIAAHLRREARAATIVQHPNVVDILDADIDENGSPYIVQELLSGENLSQYVHRAGGRLSVEETVDLLLPVVDAVGVAHSRGVIHRDLKPCNVFLALTGGTVTPKVLDFGISTIRGYDDGLAANDGTTVVGTPGYMSPEQALGGPEINASSDVWALGVMIYECIAGCSPFGTAPARTEIADLWLRTPTPLDQVVPGVPADLAKILERCLRREPESRYPSAAELARDLRNFHWECPIEPTQRMVIPANISQTRALRAAVLPLATDADANPTARVVRQSGVPAVSPGADQDRDSSLGPCPCPGPSLGASDGAKAGNNGVGAANSSSANSVSGTTAHRELSDYVSDLPTVVLRPRRTPPPTQTVDESLSTPNMPSPIVMAAEQPYRSLVSMAWIFALLALSIVAAWSLRLHRETSSHYRGGTSYVQSIATESISVAHDASHRNQHPAHHSIKADTVSNGI